MRVLLRILSLLLAVLIPIGVLDKKSASSTDESIATVTYNNDSDEAAPVQGFDMTVSSLAKPQTNVGNYLTSDAQASISPDTYSFDIGINSLSYEFQFSVHSGDTNEDLQQRLKPPYQQCKDRT